MQVSFVLQPDDLRRVWQWARMPPWAHAIGVAIAYLLMTCAVGYFNHDYLFGACLSLLILPLSLASSGFQDRRKGERAVASALTRQPNLIGPRTLELRRDGISYIRESSAETYPWGQVRGFRRHARYFLILVEDVGVIPVPLRAFADRRDAEAFWTALLAYKMAGKTAPASPTHDETVWPPPPRQIPR